MGAGVVLEASLEIESVRLKAAGSMSGIPPKGAESGGG